MASVRVAVTDTARRLACAADDMAPVLADGCTIPADVIARLHRAASVAERPQSTLRWAWRAQTARYAESGGRVDGLATLYLLATLLGRDAGARGNVAPVRKVQ